MKPLRALLNGAPFVLLLALSALVFVLTGSARDAEAAFEEALTDARPALLTAAADSAEMGALMAAPLAPTPAAAGERQPVAFSFVFGIDDCSDKVLPEVEVLNRLHRDFPGSVRGYWVPTELVSLDQVIADYEIAFPVEEGRPAPIADALGTPFVLVTEPRTGVVLDAYRPIPQDVHRQEAFLARWDRTAGLGLGIELDPFETAPLAAVAAR